MICCRIEEDSSEGFSNCVGFGWGRLGSNGLHNDSGWRRADKHVHGPTNGHSYGEHDVGGVYPSKSVHLTVQLDPQCGFTDYQANIDQAAPGYNSNPRPAWLFMSNRTATGFDLTIFSNLHNDFRNGDITLTGIGGPPGGPAYATLDSVSRRCHRGILRQRRVSSSPSVTGDRVSAKRAAAQWTECLCFKRLYVGPLRVGAAKGGDVRPVQRN